MISEVIIGSTGSLLQKTANSLTGDFTVLQTHSVSNDVFVDNGENMKCVCVHVETHFDWLTKQKQVDAENRDRHYLNDQYLCVKPPHACRTHHPGLYVFLFYRLKDS